MFAKAGCLMLVATMSPAYMVDDESGLLVTTKKIKVHDDLLTENSYCDTIFHGEAQALAAGICANCVTGLKATATYDADKDYAKSPKFVADTMGCMVTAAGGSEAALTSMAQNAGLGAEFAVCTSIHGDSALACATTVAHCGAVHWTKAVADCGSTAAADQVDCIVQSHGFLSCVASRAQYQRCLTSPMGVGLCMEKGLECVGNADMATCLTNKETAYLAANPAQGNAVALCAQYYPNAQTKCLGCAQAAKATSGNGCNGEYCLKIPGFLEDMTQCMIDADPAPANQIPTGYEGALSTCAAAFPTSQGLCLESAARCLSLHHCTGGLDCLMSDAWAYCFARKMDFEDCHTHHAGVGKCMAAGASCLAHCGTGGATACVQSDAFVTCHQGVIAQMR